jgi:hypothetical protein
VGDVSDVRGRGGRAADPADDVTASEAAGYAYCAKAWHLQHVLGKTASATARARRDAGTARHRAHGVRVERLQRLAPGLVRWSMALLVLAAVLLILALALGAR